MRFTADHAFHIGTQHLRGGTPCQDYALSDSYSIVRPAAYAIVSDGCSTGGMTDIGARIVALNTANEIKHAGTVGIDLDDIDGLVFVADKSACGILGLKDNDLLATCAYVAGDREMMMARIVGDGVIAAKQGDYISMARVEWSDNTPLYRAYLADNYASFIAKHGGLHKTPMKATFFENSKVWQRSDEREYSFDDALKGFHERFDPRSWDVIAVFSDGVTQIDGMDWRDVVTELLTFKATEGAFVKRRMNRFLKDCLQHGKGPVDDISMACVHIDHREVE